MSSESKMRTKAAVILGVAAGVALLGTGIALAQDVGIGAVTGAAPGPVEMTSGPAISVNIAGDDADGQASALRILFLLTLITLAPVLIIMLTSFTRIIIVLSLLRTALATPQSPPNQVLVGLSLFLTFFVMAPYWGRVNDSAVQPYLAKEIEAQTAFTIGMGPMREFMLGQTRENDLLLFLDMSELPPPARAEDTPTLVLIPAFILSELKTAFEIGFIIFLPFLIIDLVVASSLMSMGMMLMPPVMISLPFKILLFVLIDGWHLLMRGLALSFQ